MAQITSLEFKVTANTSQASSNLKKLTDNLERLNNITQRINNGRFYSALAQIANAFNNIKQDKMAALAKGMQAINNASHIGNTNKLPDYIRSIGHAVEMLDLGKLQALAEAAKYLRSIDRRSKVGNVIRDVQDKFSEQESVDATPVGDVTPAQTPISNVFKRKMSKYDFEIIPDSGKTVSAIGRLLMLLPPLGDVLKSVGNAAKGVAKNFALLPMTLGAKFASQVKAVTSALGGLVRQFARIALIKAIRGIISSITKSFQESQSALYQWSNAMGTEFARSMDSLATSGNYLSNSLAAMAAPIYNSLAPALDYLIDKIVTVMNWINQLFAALGGASVFTAAKKTQKTFENVGSSAGKAGGGAKKAAKELKRFILAFDEINALGSQSNGSGGGGGGGGGGGVGGLGGYEFEQLPIASAIADLANTLKGYFESSDWEGLGAFLGEKFNSLLHWIQWDDMGAALGRGFDGLIRTAYSFLTTADFKYLGGGFARFLNQAIGSIDWETLGRLWIKEITIFLDMAIGFIHNFDFKQFGSALSSLVSGIFNELAKWVADTDWTQLGTDIVNGIFDFIEGYDLIEVAKSVGTFLLNVLDAAVDLFVATVDTTLQRVIDYIESFFTGNKIEPIDLLLGSGNKKKKIEVKVSATASQLRDGIPESDKNIHGITATLEKPSDKIPLWKKILGGFTAVLKEKQDKISSKTLTGFTAKLGERIDAIGNKTITGFKAEVYTAVVKPGVTLKVPVKGQIYATTKASGGVFSGGNWSHIPQYASGTLSAGSLFVAGERGPEVVGHIGGRTEVLNASQLAATMFSSTVAAVSNLAPMLTAINSNIVAGANGIIAAQVAVNNQDEDYRDDDIRMEWAAGISRSNDLLRDQNDLLRQILEKDPTIEVTTASLATAFNRRNQRDGKTIIPVGS